MGVEIQIEPLGDHEHLVRVREGAAEAETRIRVTDGVLDLPQITGVDETRIVHETVTFLIEHQPVNDIPPMIDLDDLSDAYGTPYLDFLNRRLTPQ
ncbi:hypothetical protein [Kitasatospora sp. SUK 42]|uniref:hypothetical protein n=1 Tax=Kitasatospora sp. SUK 42 TaxID=1588882 RepID=UPI0018C95CED|nr:hypothetical protein [Kitasatospora sp. SUK 42]MBV2152028.1 hypothetical protein [Kitasatospora sp. SUK 42]